MRYRYNLDYGEGVEVKLKMKGCVKTRVTGGIFRNGMYGDKGGEVGLSTSMGVGEMDASWGEKLRMMTF